MSKYPRRPETTSTLQHLSAVRIEPEPPSLIEKVILKAMDEYVVANGGSRRSAVGRGWTKADVDSFEDEVAPPAATGKWHTSR